MLEEIHPTRTAGGQNRQFHIFITIQMAFQTSQQLCSFFDNGKVGCEIGIKHIFETKLAKCSSHFSCNQSSRLQSELFAQSSTNGRCGLHHHGFGWITQRTKHLAGMVHFGQSAGGTYGNALSAIGTRRFFKVHFKCRSNNGHKSPVYSRKCAYGLYLVTHHLTTSAHDAFIHIADDGRRQVLPIG